jgi:hypothetical protein
MTSSDEPTRPISVAELLAKNGSIGSPPVGGRRRRRRGNDDAVSVAELTGEIPIVRADVSPTLSDADGAVKDTGASDAHATETAATDSGATEVQATETAAAEVGAADTGGFETEARGAEPLETGAVETDDATGLEALETGSLETEAPGIEVTATEAPETEVPETEALETDATGSSVAGTEDSPTKESETAAQDRVEHKPVAVDAEGSDGGSDAEQMTFDPVDESAVLLKLATDSKAEEPEADPDLAELQSYLRASTGNPFSDVGGANDLARRDETTGETRTGEQSADLSTGKLAALWRGTLVVFQSVLAVLFGAGLFVAFDQLWRWNNIVALVLSVLVILGLVVAVRVVRKTEDIASTLIAVAVGALVTLGPLALLQSV